MDRKTETRQRDIYNMKSERCNGRTDGRTDKWIDGRTIGQKDEQTETDRQRNI